MKKHLLVVTQYFYPEIFRINDICAEWVNRGHDVTVITGIPNYPKGRFFPGFGYTKKRREIYHGIKVIRLPILPRGSNSLTLFLNYFTFAFSGFIWQLFTRQNADLVFCFQTSPIFQALPAVWFARRRKVPCYLYIQDLWPESIQDATGITNRHVINALSKMSVYIYNNCSKMFVTSKSFRKAISDRGIQEDKIMFWPQYAEDFYKPSDIVSPLVPPDEQFTIAFTGNIGTSQGLEILPRTAVLLRNECVRVRFLLVGEGRGMSALQDAITKLDVSDYFCFVPHQPPQEMPAILAGADAAFISFTDKPLFSMTIPAKLQSYMACGMPIIAAAGGETRRVVEEAGCGLCCDTGDAKELAEIIVEFSKMTDDRIKTMRDNAISFSETNYNKQALMDRMDVDFRLMSRTFT